MFEKGQRITSPGKYDQFNNIEYVRIVRATLSESDPLFEMNDIYHAIAWYQEKAIKRKVKLDQEAADKDWNDPEVLDHLADLEERWDDAEDSLLHAAIRLECTDVDDRQAYVEYSDRVIDEYFAKKEAEKLAEAQRQAQHEAEKAKLQKEIDRKREILYQLWEENGQAEVETYYEPENSSSSTLLKSAAVFGAGVFVGSRIAKKKEPVPAQRNESYSDKYERQKYEREKAEFIYGGSRYSSSIQREAAWNKSHQSQERKFYGQ